MKTRHILSVLVISGLTFASCSEKSKTETRELGNQVEDTFNSAQDDLQETRRI